MRNARSNLIDVEVIFQASTPRAICVREVERGADIWIPRSLCELDPRPGNLARGDTATLTGPEPVPIEKGFFLA